MLTSIVFSSFILILLIRHTIASNRNENHTAVINERHQEEYSEDNVLNIHIVPHTHDDVGWLKTVEQYYYGQNNTIQHACVSCILDSLIYALEEDPKRKFTYVEMAFFSLWWSDQTLEMKDRVHSLVSSGQLSFTNGGWVMHDEATSHFMGMIDQTTLGHDFLKNNFNYTPTTGWQLDPFGHSATQASLLSSEVGFNALYFGRIDYQDLQKRLSTKECEGIWASSPNLSNTDVLWGLTGSYQGNYGAPNGFCFDVLCDDEPLVGLNQDQLKLRVDSFLQILRTQASQTKGFNIMLTMGSDFQYENAMVNYENLDLLINAINGVDKSLLEDSGFNFNKLNAFYSTPEIYTKYKHNEFGNKKDEQQKKSDQPILESSGDILLTKHDDFFPYSDCDHCFWTGFYTSRPGLKRLERVGSSFLHAARQIETLLSKELNVDAKTGKSATYQLEDAMGVAQHHDAVSGTSKQHVANDYAKRIQAGINVAARFVSATLGQSLLNQDEKSNVLENLSYCQMLNETRCLITQDATNEMYTYVVLFNALGWNRSEIVSIPVSYEKYRIEKLKEHWEPVKADVFPNPNFSRISNSAPFSLHFGTGVIPPVGIALFRIENIAKSNVLQRGKNNNNLSISRRKILENESNDLIVENEFFKVEFKNGLMSKISSLSNDANTEIEQMWGYYSSFQDDTKESESSQLSGAYIFRPSLSNENIHSIPSDPMKTKIFRSSLMTEIHTEFKVPWIKQITRIYMNKPFIDVEYTIGPIPIDDHIGKEVVTRFNSTISSNGVFYTDSNGREFMRRERSKRQTWDLVEFEPIAGNYYPVNTAIYIEDEKNALAVLTDRSQGGSSLIDGSIELMVQRRTITDDSRGVGEPLNETDGGLSPYPPYGDASRIGNGVIISGKHRIIFGTGENVGAHLARSQMDAMFSQLHVFAASSTPKNNVPFNKKYLSSLLLKETLPSNIQLITLKKLSKSKKNLKFLLRLGHKYAKGEHDCLSNPVQINITSLFTNFLVKSIAEKTLSGNQGKQRWLKEKLCWRNCDTFDNVSIPSEKIINGSSKFVTLNPMEIKTFEVDAKYK